MQDKLLEMLLKEDEITWQTIILDLVKTGELDPWNVDISILSNKYLEVIKRLQKANLFISGKVLLASALLLKIKSDKLLNEDFANFDAILFPPPEVESLDDFLDYKSKRIELDTKPRLTIKTPQARKKKVTVDDLISALEKALEVNERKILRIAERQKIPENLVIPEKKIDITLVIKNLYEKIIDIFKHKPSLKFSELIPKDDRLTIISTFSPLLHLDNQEKIILTQEEPFTDIDIKLISKDL